MGSLQTVEDGKGEALFLHHLVAGFSVASPGRQDSWAGTCADGAPSGQEWHAGLRACCVSSPSVPQQLTGLSWIGGSAMGQFCSTWNADHSVLGCLLGGSGRARPASRPLRPPVEMLSCLAVMRLGAASRVHSQAVGQVRLQERQQPVTGRAQEWI